jgi:Alginate O-acetyl transferase AlgF
VKNVLLAIALILLAFVAFPQDGLYAPVLPNDTALVRVINATGEEGAPVSIDIGTTRIGPVAQGVGTPYHPVRPGVYVIFANGNREALTAASETFHTVLITSGGIAIVRDQHHEDPLRSQLILYNGTSGPLRLDAIVPSAPLLAAIGPGEGDAIVINAIPVTIAAIRSGAADAADAAAEDKFETSLTLERGESFALVVAERGAALTGFVVAGEVVTRTE